MEIRAEGVPFAPFALSPLPSALSSLPSALLPHPNLWYLISSFETSERTLSFIRLR